MSSQTQTAVRQVFRELHGIVVSAGRMQKTVKVRVGGQQWNQKVQKMFTKPKSYLVHDPNTSLRTGDVVSIVPGWRTSRHKRHVVKNIIAPYGTPIEERPPIPSEEERLAARIQQREAKEARRAIGKHSTTTSKAAPESEVD
ncbi:37S ribosomal protein S17 [Colletotrichum sidae]|uniref:37S ribosomal protein S17 n=2 Tax=Colletotrichum orbiculare species complex TaxID=2707354 RepID=N4V5R0_COLOR|nr:37S ribosomal protein S17 [Colletotrichum orbiculare MAFF 240422]TDZ78945.1 37S ribosomal protein S17 [Colletotrichum sidae]